MEPLAVGKVLVAARIENMGDMLMAERGLMKPEEVHRVDVADALVDTGSTYLAMPKTLIEQLGFTKPFTTCRSRTATGLTVSNVYGPVKLTVKDRFCTVDVAETADGNPVLIGQVPLEIMDYVVDPRGQQLVGNPAHGGQWMIDMF